MVSEKGEGLPRKKWAELQERLPEDWPDENSFMPSNNPTILIL
jgi:hypothetical protein